MLACLSLVVFGVDIVFLLNWNKVYYLKILLLLLAISLFFHLFFILGLGFRG